MLYLYIYIYNLRCHRDDTAICNVVYIFINTLNVMYKEVS